MSDDRIELDVTLKDKASAGLEDIADLTAKVEKSDPEVAVTADTDAAKADLGEVADGVARLEKSDAVVTIRAQIDDAKAQLKDLKAAEESLTGDGSPMVQAGKHVDDYSEKMGKADDVTHGFVGNAVSEIPAIGDAFGPAAEAAGQLVEGLLGGEVAIKGLITAAAPIAGLVGLIQIMTKQFETQKKIDAFNKRKVDEFAAALETATDKATALQTVLESQRKIEFTDLQGNVRDATGALADLGLSYQDFVDIVAGGQPAIDAWKTKMGDSDAALGQFNSTLDGGISRLDAYATLVGSHADPKTKAYGDTLLALEDTLTNTDSAVQKNIDKNKVFGRVLDDTAGHVDGMTASVDGAVSSLDKLRGRMDLRSASDQAQDALNAFNLALVDPKSSLEDIDDAQRNAQESLLNYAAMLKDKNLLPSTVETRVVAEIDAGQLQAAEDELNTWAQRNPVKVQVRLVAGNPVIFDSNGNRFPIQPDGGKSAAPPVNIVMPVGSRPVDVQRQIAGAARRSGRRFGAPILRRT